MREIFISKQKNRNGRRFGFARFRAVSDVHKLARQLDQIVIGGLKLYVNIPKYGRDTTRMEMALPEPTRHDVKRQHTARHWGQHNGLNSLISYAEVVARDKHTGGQAKGIVNENHNRPASHSSLTIDIPLNDKKWFSEAWVGRMKNLIWFDKLEEDPLWDFGADITPKYLGDDMVLLLGLSDDRAERMMQEVEANLGPMLGHSTYSMGEEIFPADRGGNGGCGGCRQ